VPSNAFAVHLPQLLEDANELDDAHSRLRTGAVGRQHGLASLNRAAVVVTVSAWESYIEELMRECLRALQPAGGAAVGAWPALNAYVLGLLGRFNTPDTQNVDVLIDRCLSLSTDLRHLLALDDPLNDRLSAEVAVRSGFLK
jgi:hypothetical protein